MPCIVLYSIVLYWASPNLWYSMYCIVFFCIVLTSPNMAQSHQDSLSWLCLHLLLINCVSVLAWCVYLYNVHGGSCCEFDQVWEDPPNPLLQTIPLQVASALGSVTVTLYWINLWNADIWDLIWQSYQCWKIIKFTSGMPISQKLNKLSVFTQVH